MLAVVAVSADGGGRVPCGTDSIGADAVFSGVLEGRFLGLNLGYLFGRPCDDFIVSLVQKIS